MKKSILSLGLVACSFLSLSVFASTSTPSYQTQPFTPNNIYAKTVMPEGSYTSDGLQRSLDISPVSTSSCHTVVMTQDQYKAINTAYWSNSRVRVTYTCDGAEYGLATAVTYVN